VAVHLKGVAVDDLSVEFFSQYQRQIALT
jgi:hypothetical protein